jgi:hypothetical protein
MSNFDKINTLSNVNMNIAEIKNFYLNYLINVLKKPFIEGIIILYKSVLNNNNDIELFKEALRGIKTLTKQQILDEVRRIKTSANLLNDKLINLINCVFKSYIILLIFNETKAKNFLLSDDYLNNINANDFIYLCYKELSQDIVLNISPIFDYINNKNTDKLNDMIKQAIEKTIFNLLPIDNIMNYYLNNILIKNDSSFDNKIADISQYVIKTNKKIIEDNIRDNNTKIKSYNDKINENIDILNIKIQNLENTINESIRNLSSNNNTNIKNFSINNKTEKLKNSINRIKTNSSESNKFINSVINTESEKNKKTIILEKTPEKQILSENNSSNSILNSNENRISSTSKILSESSSSKNKNIKKQKNNDITLSSISNNLTNSESRIKIPKKYPTTNLQKTMKLNNSKNKDNIKTNSISLNSVEISKFFDP